MIDCSKTVNFLKEKERMCHHIINGSECCKPCPLFRDNNGKDCNCTLFMYDYPEKAIGIVQKWSDEHPQRTYLTELLKHFPNAKLGGNGVPMRICPSRLGLKDIEECYRSCVKCWNQPIKESENND